MTVAQAAFQTTLDPPFGAVVARQLSVWPFAARTARLVLVVDPSLPDRAMRRGLLRAMQQAYFASDGYSQTRAVREAALAAHYVLRHHNRDVLPLEQVNAASAVAALRGDVAYVALAGHAAAFAFCDGQLTGQRGILRLPRPLGLEQDPLITLWSTPFHPGDRLVLVCSGAWRSDSQRVIQDILSNTSDPALAEQQLADALGSDRPAGVLVVSAGGTRQKRHLQLVPPVDVSSTAPAPRPARPSFGLRRWLTSIFGLVLLAMVIGAAFSVIPEPPRPPVEHSAIVAFQDRVDRVSPAMAVRLGPSASNVVDVAIGDDTLYTLDVVEGSVRAFPVGAHDQLPTPETLVARSGSPIDAAGHRLSPPVAVEYVNGGLIIVDQSRAVVQVDHDRKLSLHSVPTSTRWQTLGALGADAGGQLLFLDSGSQRLLAYPPLSQRVLDPPRVMVDPTLDFERVAEIIGVADALAARLDDGTVLRLGADGSHERLVVRPSDGRPMQVRSIASDRAGGVFLLDPANARVVQATFDGSVLREIRDPALGGVREIRSSLDGRHLFGLVASGVLVFDTLDL